MEQNKTERIGVRLESDLKNEANKLAKKENVTLSRFIRNLLKNHIWKVKRNDTARKTTND